MLEIRSWLIENWMNEYFLGTRGKVRGKGQLRNRYGRGFHSKVGVSPHSSG